MVWRKRISHLCFALALFVAGNLTAQEEETAEIVSEFGQNETPAPKMNHQDWERAIDGVDFGKASQPEKEEEELEETVEENDVQYDDSNFDWNFGLDKTVASFILGGIIVVIIILIVFLIIRQVRQADVRVQSNDESMSYNLKNIEENLPESDLQRHLRLALETEDYKAAIRIYYLAVIQSLSQKKHIKWQREKTNYEYLLEVRGKSLFQSFSNLTLTYEIVWYGDALVSKSVFQSIEPSFSQVLKQIENEH
jgi:predicted Holliday junction resolvase-like endonuclease